MSPQRLADAAHIVPYPTHTGHHDYQSSSTSDSAARSRDTKPTRPRSRGRHERGARSEDEIRFNTGVPRSPRRRPFFGSPPAVFRFPGEERWRNNESPPGYEEAISTPPLSGCPSTVTLATATTGQPPVPSALSISTAPGADDNTHNPADSAALRAESPLPNSPSSDSDNSLLPAESISREELDEPSTPGYGAALRSHPYLQGVHSNGTQFDVSRDGPIEHLKSPSKLFKRRNNTLSPLRTLFPLKSRPIQNAPHSAHPSPVSPYDTPRSSFSAFRSTTSLMPSLSTVSLGRFGSNDSKRSKVKSLFSFKGKTRAKEAGMEFEGAWEVVDSRVRGIAENGGKAVNLVPVEVLLKSSPPSPPVNAALPQSAALSSATEIPPPAVHVHIAPSAPTPVQPSSPAPSQIQSPARTTFSRDEKLRDMYMNLNARRPAAAAAARPPQTVRTPSPLPCTSEPQGPIVTTVRTRKFPSALASQKTTANSLTEDPPSQPQRDIRAGVELEFQQALDTPLPDSPTAEVSYVPHVSNTPSDLRPLRNPSPTPSIGPEAMPSAPQKVNADSPDQRLATPVPLDTTRPTTPTSVASLCSESYSPMRHHYPGRPLPRPPADRTPRIVDSTYAPFGVPLSPGENAIHVDAVVPEGLLIDFNDEPHELVALHSDSPDSSHVQLPDSPIGSQSSNSTRLVAAFPPLPPSPPLSPVEPSDRPRNNSQPPVDQMAMSILPNDPLYSEYTDLDMLVDNISGDSRDGLDYDVGHLASRHTPEAFIAHQQTGTPPRVGIHWSCNRRDWVRSPLQLQSL